MILNVPVPFQGIRTPGSATQADALVVPMGRVFETHGLSKIRFVVWVNAADTQVAPGLQYGNDPLNWGTGSGGADDVGVVAAYHGASWLTGSAAAATGGRHVLSTWVDAPSGFKKFYGTNDGDPLDADRLFARPVLLVRNATGTTTVTGGVAAMQVEVYRLESGTVMSAPLLVPSGHHDGTNRTQLFTPLTDGMAAGRIGKVRGTLEMYGSKDFEAVLGYQTSDDLRTWDTAVEVSGTSTTADGIVYPTSWTTVSVSNKKAVRWGVFGKMTTGSAATAPLRAGVVSLRLDWRE